MQDEISNLNGLFPEELSTPVLSHFEALDSLADLSNKDIVDVGCGFGEMTRAMSDKASNVVGVDCSTTIMEKLLTQAAQPGLTFKYGVGENLPLEDESVDLTVYINSFHHIQPSHWARSLREVMRVLKNDESLLYVAEPIPEGDYFAVTRIVDDELSLRTEAFETLMSQKLFHIKQTFFYQSPKVFSSFEEFEFKSIAISAGRAQQFFLNRETVKESFLRLGKKDVDNKIHFKQPMRVLLMSPIIKQNNEFR